MNNNMIMMSNIICNPIFNNQLVNPNFQNFFLNQKYLFNNMPNFMNFIPYKPKLAISESISFEEQIGIYEFNFDEVKCIESLNDSFNDINFLDE